MSKNNILILGYISENAEFGNTYSAQSFQPSYAGGRAGSGSDNIAMLEKAVPGIPGQDYPILAEVPETSFSCDGQVIQNSLRLVSFVNKVMEMFY